MKIRNGFVSNSSSSSFCIYGTDVGGLVGEFEDKDDDVETVVEEKGLELHYYNNSTYVGISWKDIKDDETGLQFKQRIEKVIKELFGENKCRTIEVAWYNG